MEQMRKQLDFFTTETEKNPSEYKTCAFTGHRVLEKDFSKAKLKKETEAQIKNGVEIFFNGMAMGFDLAAAECVLALKKKYPQIKLIACVPCYGQEKYFSETDKRRYVEILKNTDERMILSDHYFQGCMQARDKYMAERADVLIAYCNKPTGGAAYTVKIFQKLHPDGLLIFI